MKAIASKTLAAAHGPKAFAAYLRMCHLMRVLFT